MTAPDQSQSADFEPTAVRHVFISYSRKDSAFAERLERDLKQQGLVIWRYHSSIVGGEDWYKSIV